MPRGGVIAGFRRHQGVIGLIAAYGFLLNLIVAAVFGPLGSSAEASLLDAVLGSPLCASGGDGQHRDAPALPSHQGQDCPLCGNTCPMGGCAPVGPIVAKAGLIEPFLFVATRIAFQPQPVIRATQALYPSDTVSQAPPPAA